MGCWGGSRERRARCVLLFGAVIDNFFSVLLLSSSKRINMVRRDRCSTKEGAAQWINLEPCGLICGLLSYLLIFFGQYAATLHVILPWLGYSFGGVVNIILFNLFSLLAAYSHFKAMTTDPGAVPRGAKPLPDDIQEQDLEANEKAVGTCYRKFCKRCKAFKPTRAHHCSICRRCVLKMDHHCPWVNNCVGIGNHKLFLLFIFWINVISFYAILLVLAKYTTCYFSDRFPSSCGGTHDQHLLCALLLGESVLFGVFTACMMGEQASGFTSSQTLIDRLKSSSGTGGAGTPGGPAASAAANTTSGGGSAPTATGASPSDSNAGLREIFGGGPGPVSFQSTWMLPTPARFHDSIKDHIFGYRYSGDDSSRRMGGTGEREEEKAPWPPRERDRESPLGVKQQEEQKEADAGDADEETTPLQPSGGCGNTQHSVLMAQDAVRTAGVGEGLLVAGVSSNGHVTMRKRGPL